MARAAGLRLSRASARRRVLRLEAAERPADGSGRAPAPPPAEEREAAASKARRARRPRVTLTRSQLVNKRLITRTSGADLGVASQLWVDTDNWEVVALDVRESLVWGSLDTVLLSSLRQVGDVILVHDEEALERGWSAYGYAAVVGAELVTESGEPLGRVRDFEFSPDDGRVTRLLFDAFGVPAVPMSAVSTYTLSTRDVISASPDRLIVAEGAEARIQQLTASMLQRIGLTEAPWETAMRAQYIDPSDPNAVYYANYFESRGTYDYDYGQRGGRGTRDFDAYDPYATSYNPYTAFEAREREAQEAQRYDRRARKDPGVYADRRQRFEYEYGGQDAYDGRRRPAPPPPPPPQQQQQQQPAFDDWAVPEQEAERVVEMAGGPGGAQRASAGAGGGGRGGDAGVDAGPPPEASAPPPPAPDARAAEVDEPPTAPPPSPPAETRRPPARFDPGEDRL